MNDTSNINSQRFKKILQSRIGFEWPYSSHFNGSRGELEDWLRVNCQKEYRIFVGRHEQIVYFKNDQDFTLYQLTWNQL